MSTRRHPLVATFLVGAALALLPSCGSSTGGDGDNVRVTVSPISHSTTLPFFTMGHELSRMPFGGIGVLHTGSSWRATIEFIDVPEGKYVPRYDGYGVLAHNISGLGAVQSYCEIEWGIDIGQLRVISGGYNRTIITPAPITGCGHVGVDRVIANPEYTFDPEHRWAGASSGENVIEIRVDDLEPFSDVDIQVCDEDLGQDCSASPFGIFPDLPDPPDVVWPDPAAWEVESMLIPTESHGDLHAYLVVKPDATPTSWSVRVVDENGVYEEINLRVSNTSTVSLTAR